MPLIEAQYASEDGRRTARVYQAVTRRWRVVYWQWRPSAEEQHSESFTRLTAAQHAAEAWVGDREG